MGSAKNVGKIKYMIQCTKLVSVQLEPLKQTMELALLVLQKWLYSITIVNVSSIILKHILALVKDVSKILMDPNAKEIYLEFYKNK